MTCKVMHLITLEYLIIAPYILIIVRQKIINIIYANHVKSTYMPDTVLGSQDATKTKNGQLYSQGLYILGRWKDREMLGVRNHQIKIQIKNVISDMNNKQDNLIEKNLCTLEMIK